MLFLQRYPHWRQIGAVLHYNTLLGRLIPYQTAHTRKFTASTLQKEKFSYLDLEISQLVQPRSIHPKTPARTRFAPSPTGFLHLGSLRTALYNYLLAKSTGGSFILRLEDTDRTRIVPGAEEDIYNTLEWCKLTVDEGPLKGGPYGPYRQLERRELYHKYANILIEKGLAYKCYCSKERLNQLRESAMKLKPITTVTYDRHCLGTDHPESNVSPVIRFKSPEKYQPFFDLTHGKLDLQPQINFSDRRFDDFVIIKSDGYPTYHFANIVDDHLMKITHVIRGEEWLTSTPKHVALYNAFGWEPPKFVHIPLLTSLKDKKLSKRSGDIGISQIKLNGILPEALVNFTALFGWSPPRDHSNTSSSEVMSLDTITSKFSLDNLTKGNAKVDTSKLQFFNKSHIQAAMADKRTRKPYVDILWPEYLQKYPTLSMEHFENVLLKVGPTLLSLQDVASHSYLFSKPNYIHMKPKQVDLVKSILMDIQASKEFDFDAQVQHLLKSRPDLKKKDVFQALRYAYTGGMSGLTIPLVLELIGKEEGEKRLDEAIHNL